MSFDPWATPAGVTTGWQALPQDRPEAGRRRRDLLGFVQIVAAMTLLGAPAGLLWAHLAPRFTVVFANGQPTTPNIESSRAFVAVDGVYLAVMLGTGLLCGAAAWWLFRRSGPWTVLALVVGGALGALVAARVGEMPGHPELLQRFHSAKDSVGLYFRSGLRQDGTFGLIPTDHVPLRAPWAAVAWPVGALVAFIAPGFVRPEELD